MEELFAYLTNLLKPKDSRRNPKRLTTSAEGVELIKSFEGLSLDAYQDVGGVFTVGYGHTKHVEERMRISLEQAHRLLVQDVIEHEKHIHELVIVPLKQNEFDALSSWVFNLGGGALAYSTLLQKLNNKKYDEVPDEMLRWNKVKGVAVSGLTRRRLAEAELWSRND